MAIARLDTEKGLDSYHLELYLSMHIGQSHAEDSRLKAVAQKPIAPTIHPVHTFVQPEFN